MNNLFLGIDCSTQSMSGLLLEETVAGGSTGSKVIYEASLNFEVDFPHYGTKNGVLVPEGDKSVQVSPPLLWVEALEALFEKMLADKVELGRIACIGVSGQQHASIYLNESVPGVLGVLAAEKTLTGQLQDCFSRPISPIWMDSSTGAECREIAHQFGGDAEVCKATGSMCFERFAGPQIRKFFKTDPDAYARTSRICLVSSFLPSILAGKIISIDPGDGAGMNLMDINTCKWNQAALEATAPNLHSKLGEISSSHSIAGNVCGFFVKKFGLHSDCKIIPGTGDNPSSLVGLGLVSPGRIGISLGTSDTLFACMSRPNTDPRGESHVFGSPAGDYMVLSVFKNGSLARERLKDEFDLSWEEFGHCLETPPVDQEEQVLLPYFDNEIIPRISVAGVQKFNLANASPGDMVGALVRGQVTSMAIHSEWLGDPPRQIYVTGGASANQNILQMIADVFGTTVGRQHTSNAAGLGAALRAQQALNLSQGSTSDWEQIVSPHVPSAPSDFIKPNREHQQKLLAFREIYRKQENEYISKLAG